MNDVSNETFIEAIRATHGAKAVLSGQERVVETFQGDTVWEGDVLVFSLQGHPTASKCYAWEVGGEITAVLGEPPVDSAVAAVRASIAATEAVGASR